MTKAELFYEVGACNRSVASRHLARDDFKKNATSTTYVRLKNAERISRVEIVFSDHSYTEISIEDWEWVRGW